VTEHKEPFHHQGHCSFRATIDALLYHFSRFTEAFHYGHPLSFPTFWAHGHGAVRDAGQAFQALVGLLFSSGKAYRMILVLPHLFAAYCRPPAQKNLVLRDYFARDVPCHITLERVDHVVHRWSRPCAVVLSIVQVLNLPSFLVATCSNPQCSFHEFLDKMADISRAAESGHS
jgi:hypothetical protein